MKTALLLALIVFMSFQEELEDDGVLILTDKNVNQSLKEHPCLMIKFYAPWCDHCKQLAPEYSIAAKQIKSKGCILAQVDATENSVSSSEYLIKSYPTMYLFLNGAKVEYRGERKSDEIIKWIENKISAQFYEIENERQFMSLTRKNEPSIILVAGPSDVESIKKFKEMMLAYDGFNCYIMKTTNPPQELKGVSLPAYVLAKNVGQKISIYSGDFSANSIINYMMSHMIPAFGELEPQNVKFSKRIEAPVVLIFSGNLSGNLIAQISTLANEYSEYKFMHSNYSTDYAHKYTVSLGVDEKSGDTLFLFTDNFKTPYQMESLLTIDNIKMFLSDYKDKKLKKHIRSEPISQSLGPVKKLVGKNFNEIVKDKKKEVLVKFYAPWCHHCKEFIPIYEELAKRLITFSNDLIIAEIDATANDVDAEKIESYPTIKLYTKSNKVGIEYDGERSVEGLYKFLSENTSLLIDTDDVKTSL